MAIRITATEAARSFSDLLSRVRWRGESFDIVRNGETVAHMSAAPAAASATVSRLLEVIETAPRDPGFADDLERVQSEQPSVPSDPWAT